MSGLVTHRSAGFLALTLALLLVAEVHARKANVEVRIAPYAPCYFLLMLKGTESEKRRLGAAA